MSCRALLAAAPKNGTSTLFANISAYFSARDTRFLARTHWIIKDGRHSCELGQMFPSKLEQFGGMEVSRQFLSSLLHSVSDTSPLLILGRVLLFPVTILLIRWSLIFFFKKLIREKDLSTSRCWKKSGIEKGKSKYEERKFWKFWKKFFKIGFQQRRDYLPRIVRLLDRTWIVETKWWRGSLVDTSRSNGSMFCLRVFPPEFYLLESIYIIWSRFNIAFIICN